MRRRRARSDRTLSKVSSSGREREGEGVSSTSGKERLPRGKHVKDASSKGSLVSVRKHLVSAVRMPKYVSVHFARAGVGRATQQEVGQIVDAASIAHLAGAAGSGEAGETARVDTQI